MSKILLTGMSAPHMSTAANRRSLSFAGLVNKTLDSEHAIDWIAPSVSWTADFFSQYDSIFVGVSPITSLGASNAYGALHTIGLLYADPRLRLFIDAPNPVQIIHSLNSVLASPDSLFKPFFKARKEYQEAQTMEASTLIQTAIYWLGNYRWPITTYPRLPWGQEDPALALPNTAEWIIPLNLDAVLLEGATPSSREAVDRWVVDDDRSSWRDSVARTLDYPVISMKRNKFSTDQEIGEAMAGSTGVLLSPTKRGRTWWSYRYPQALSLGVPIVTEWRDSSVLGQSWSVLASQMEHMSEDTLMNLASEQRQAYLNGIEGAAMAKNSLELFLGLVK